jgi:hypothetical protein
VLSGTDAATREVPSCHRLARAPTRRAWPLPILLLLAGVARTQEVKPPPSPPQELGVFRKSILNGPEQTVSYFLHGASPRVEILLREVERVENEMIHRRPFAAEAARNGTPTEQAAWHDEIEAFREELDARWREIEAVHTGGNVAVAAKDRQAAERARLALQNRRDAGAQAQQQRIQREQNRLTELRRRQADDRDQAEKRALRWAEEERCRAEALQRALEADFAYQDRAFSPYFHGNRQGTDVIGDSVPVIRAVHRRR